MCELKAILICAGNLFFALNILRKKWILTGLLVRRAPVAANGDIDEFDPN